MASGIFWTLFGIGATIGPLCVGFFADRVGLYRSLILTFSAAALSILLLVIYHSTLFYALSAFSMGVLLAAIPSLVSSRVLDLVGVAQHPIFWGKVTLYCAISQAVAAHVMSYLLRTVFRMLPVLSLRVWYLCLEVVRCCLFARVPEREESAV